MNLPIEIMQQRRDGPLLLVLAEFARIRPHARLHREHVFSQALRLHEFANNRPRLIPIHREQVIMVSTFRKSGPVAQLGARFHGMEEVDGSNPSRSTNHLASFLAVPPSHFRSTSVLARAPASLRPPRFD